MLEATAEVTPPADGNTDIVSKLAVELQASQKRTNLMRERLESGNKQIEELQAELTAARGDLMSSDTGRARIAEEKMVKTVLENKALTEECSALRRDLEDVTAGHELSRAEAVTLQANLESVQVQLRTCQHELDALQSGKSNAENLATAAEASLNAMSVLQQENEQLKTEIVKVLCQEQKAAADAERSKAVNKSLQKDLFTAQRELSDLQHMYKSESMRGQELEEVLHAEREHGMSSTAAEIQQLQNALLEEHNNRRSIELASDEIASRLCETEKEYAWVKEQHEQQQLQMQQMMEHVNTTIPAEEKQKLVTILKSLQLEVMQLQQTVVDLTETNQELKKTDEAKTAQFEVLSSQLRDTNQEVLTLQAQILESQGKLAEVKREAKSFKNEVMMLQQQILLLKDSSSEQQSNESQKLMEKAHEELKQLHKELADAQQRTMLSRDTKSAQEQQLQIKENQLHELHAENQNLRSVLASQQISHQAVDDAALVQERNALRERCRELEFELIDVQNMLIMSGDQARDSRQLFDSLQSSPQSMVAFPSPALTITGNRQALISDVGVPPPNQIPAPPPAKTPSRISAEQSPTAPCVSPTSTRVQLMRAALAQR